MLLTHWFLEDLGVIYKCIFNLMLLIFRYFHDNAPRWMPLDLTDAKSTLVLWLGAIRHQAIIWSNDDPVQWQIYASPDLSELINSATYGWLNARQQPCTKPSIFHAWVLSFLPLIIRWILSCGPFDFICCPYCICWLNLICLSLKYFYSFITMINCLFVELISDEQMLF